MLVLDLLGSHVVRYRCWPELQSTELLYSVGYAEGQLHLANSGTGRARSRRGWAEEMSIIQACRMGMGFRGLVGSVVAVQ